MTTASVVLIGIGAVGILTSIAGGGVKASGIEVPPVANKRQRVQLLLVSVVLLVIGLGLEIVDKSRSSPVANEDEIKTNEVIEQQQPSADPLRSSTSAAPPNGSRQRPGVTRTAPTEQSSAERKASEPQPQISVSSTNQSGGVTAGQIENLNQVNE